MVSSLTASRVRSCWLISSSFSLQAETRRWSISALAASSKFCSHKSAGVFYIITLYNKLNDLSTKFFIVLRKMSRKSKARACEFGKDCYKYLKSSYASEDLHFTLRVALENYCFAALRNNISNRGNINLMSYQNNNAFGVAVVNN